MNILLKHEDFSAIHYDLQIGEAALEFTGETEPFALYYSQIIDFVITTDSREKMYFTMTCAGCMYEGRILEAQDAESFAALLKEKLGGILNIEITRN